MDRNARRKGQPSNRSFRVSIWNISSPCGCTISRSLKRSMPSHTQKPCERTTSGFKRSSSVAMRVL